jgi:tungstate transport system substrate-binding protein
MNSTSKIAVIALIVIIVVSVGAYAYLSQPAQPATTSYNVTIGSSVNGTTAPSSGTYSYTEGSTIAFAATPNSGYQFDYWLIDGEANTTNPITVTITSDFDISPVFALQSQPTTTTYTVTVQSSPNGTTTPSPGTHSYASGGSVTFAGVPNDGYKFDYWVIDGVVDNANPTTKTITADMTVTPVFTLASQEVVTPTIYAVTIQAAQNGTVSPPAGVHDYVLGTAVTFTATANNGYKFDHWIIGSTTNTTNPVTVTITSDITVTPVFTFLSTPVTLTVSSTTSLYETGVEDGAIKPAFQAKYPWITVNFLSQGTGAAIQTAMRGDADMIMVHDPGQESTFLSNGYGVNRKIIAYNFFIIVGPVNDPANITGLTPIAALQRIYSLGQSGQALWVSRGDGSGTNSKEKNLWAAAGINWTQIRTQTSWYKETGQGMTATLVVANYFGGYTISDTATYLTNTNAKNINMKIVVQASKDLLNVYSVIADNPLNANLTSTHFDASMLFIQYIVSDEGQQLLANYGTSTFGQPLFAPFVPLASNPTSNATLLAWIQNYAYIPANVTECPAAYRHNASSLYSPSYDALSGASYPIMSSAAYLAPALAAFVAMTVSTRKMTPLGKRRL